MPKNIPTDLLRTFVTIVKEGGFSHAGKRLGRSQPAISLQMNRLEQLVDKPIMVRDGRSVKLTEEGELLMDYGRRILRLNDEVVLRLAKPEIIGKVRLGISHEFTISCLPDFLVGLAESYPGINLEVISEPSSQLLVRRQKGELDLVVAIHKGKDAGSGSHGWYERLVWVTDSKHARSHYETVPLVVAPAGCVYRHRMLNALNRQEIPWRIVYTGTSYGGICAAVTAGFGMTALSNNTVPESLHTFACNDQLPALADIGVALYYERLTAEPAVALLAEYILNPHNSRGIRTSRLDI